MRGEYDGFETRGAYFVDGDGFDAVWETGEESCLSGGGLSYGALEDVAHVYVCYFGDGDFGLFEGGFDGYGAELGGGDWEEGAIELDLLVKSSLKWDGHSYFGCRCSGGAQNVCILYLLSGRGCSAEMPLYLA